MNSNTAYSVAQLPSGFIYRINLQTGGFDLAATIPGNPGLNGLALVPNSTVAYATGFNSKEVYRVDLATGVSSVVAICPTSISGMSLPNRSTAYVAGANGQAVYQVNLTTGQVSTLATIPGNTIFDVGLADTTTPYAITTIGNICLIDPTTGGFSIAADLGITLQFISFLLQLPTNGLYGNNLTFVNYLNKNAPFDALFSLTVQDNYIESLESAIPTRNAFSQFAVDNNLFFLNHDLSLHLRNHRRFRNRIFSKNPTSIERGNDASKLFASSEEFRVLSERDSSEDESLAPTEPKLSSEELNAPCEQSHPHEELKAPFDKKPIWCTPSKQERPYTLWFDAVGAFASQKEQHQTVGFHPMAGGFILAADKAINENILIGGGAAYTFTHIFEDKNAGHSNINQEYVVFYGTWENDEFYINGALWTALFQTHQMRNIHLTDVNFTARSHPQGEQLAPHLEFGYDLVNHLSSTGGTEITIDPFIMLDCINSWQRHYKEKGNGPFLFRQKAQYSAFLRTEAGVRFYETFTFDRWRLSLEEKGSWVNKAPFGVGRVSAALIGSPGSFTVETLSDVQNLGTVEMVFIFEPLNLKYPYGSISYQGEFGSSFQSHQATLEASWNF